MAILAVGLIAAKLTVRADDQAGAGGPGEASIHVAMDDNYPPYIFEDDNGVLQGILVDQWRLWERKTGVAVKLEAMAWRQALDRMRDGDFDVIDTVFETPSRREFLDFSRPYTRIEVAIFFRSEIAGIAGIESLKGFTVGVKRGDAAVDLLREAGIANLQFHPSYESLVSAAAHNKVDVFVADVPPTLYYLYKAGMHDVFRRSAPISVGEFHRAVRKGNAEMLAHVEDGFARISAGELAQIDRRWMGAGLASDRYVRLLIVGAVSALALAIVFVAWTWTLRRTVAKRTAALRESETRFRVLFEHAPVAYQSLDGNGCFIDANERLCGLLGCSREELLGRSFGSFWPEHRRAGFSKRFEGMVKKGCTAGELEIVREDGSLRTVYLEGRVQYDDAGRFMRTHCILHDLSDRVRAEMALRENEERLRMAINAAHLGTFDWDMTTDRISWSRRHEEMWGYAPDEFDGSFAAFAARVQADDVDRVNADLARCIAEREPFERRFRVIWPDGSVHWIQGIGRITFDADGNPLRMTGVVMEVTEQVQAEARVRSMARFPAENPSPVLRVGRDGSVLYANEAAAVLLESWRTSVGGPAPSEWRERIATALATGLGSELDLECAGHVYSIRLVPVAGEDDVNLFGRDVTERRRAEAQVEAERRRFEQLFEVSPIATWLEDFTALITWMDGLRAEGVTDLGAYLIEHPECVREALELVRVLDLNPAAVEQNGATSKGELMTSLPSLFALETLDGFTQGLLALWEGRSMIEYESVSRRLDGEMIDVLIRIHVPRRDDRLDYGFATVTSVDISEHRRIERALRYHQDLLTETGRIAHVGGWEFDVATGVGTWTEEVARIHDLDPADPTNAKLGLSFYDDDSRALIEQAIKDAIELGEPYDLELQLHTRKGVRKWVRTIGHPVFKDGRVVRLRGSFQDISDRKREKEKTLEANRALRMLSECNQALVRATEESVLLDKVCSAMVEVGRHAFAWVGYLGPGAGSMIRAVSAAGAGKDRVDLFANAVHETDPVGEAIRMRSVRVIDDFASLPEETAWRDEAWRNGFAALIVLPLVSAERVLGAICVYASDRQAFDEADRALLVELADDVAFGITAIRTRAAHARAEASLETAQAIARMGNWDLDPNVGTGWWSREMFRLLEFDPEKGTPPLTEFMKMVHPDDREGISAVHRRLMEKGGSNQSCYRMYLPSGGLRWIESIVTAEPDADGQVRKISGTLRDISERKLAEEALRESEERFRTLIEQALDSITVVDGDGRVGYQSPASERILGLSPQAMLGHTIFEWLHPEDAAAIRESLAGALRDPGSLFRVTGRYAHADGSWRFLESVGRLVSKPGEPVRIVVNSRDTTAARRLEEQFRQAQKMEAVGRLAGGVAHDFNNILTVVQGNVSLLEIESDLGASARESVTEIKRAASRAANLTRQMLAFSRRQTIQPQYLDLNDVVTNVARMLNRLLGEDVRLELRLAPQEVVVFADTGMLEQVLVNLAVNARDAMPKGGRLIIETGMDKLDGRAAAAISGARPGEFSWLSVSDTGMGMTPEVMANIFEPFFTTKETGRGTGLGLATVHGIVEQHNGWMEVTSEVGRGSRFRAFLPRAARRPDAVGPAAAAFTARKGSETILVVEDETAVRQVARNLLAPLGYRVLEAESGPGALKLWAEYRDAIDLVLTDLVMPDGMSGLELGARLLRDRPRLKIIYTSGYSAQIVGRHDELREGVNFLAKPFDLDRLMKAIRGALDG